MKPAVSFVMPAYNAAATLDDAVSSVVAQGARPWELVIVDDGSSDATEDLARAWAERDSRIRVVRQENQGASAARNTGLAAARHDWVVFLDSDDWIAPDFLKRMTKPLWRRDVDAVFCGAVDVSADGEHGKHWYPPSREQFFPVTAHDCPIAVHGVLARRSLVEAVGGWDTELATCEDWDLWQRLARTTARFANIGEVLAFIRLRPGSLSRSTASQLANNGRIVIERGHAADPRVESPDPRWANGLPTADLDEALAQHIAWAAGLDIAGGGDGQAIIAQLHDREWAHLNPWDLAVTLQDAVSHGSGRLEDDWLAHLPAVTGLLETLEEKGGAHALAQRTLRHLETLVFRHASLAEPVLFGATYWVRFDLPGPVDDVDVPDGATRLVAVAYIEGRRAGAVVLPVLDGHVDGAAIVAALAERHGARLMLRHLQGGGWRTPRLWTKAGALALRPSTLKFGLNLAQFRRPSQIERLRGFAQASGRDLALASGVLRAGENGRRTVFSNTDEDLGDAGGDSAGPSPEAEDDEYGANYWEDVFATQNPWDYTNDYEQTKYHQTLDLLPPGRIGRALELACAEGHFTRLLAPRVDELVATDISETALERAAEACAEHPNVAFQPLDLRTDQIPGMFDLIVCSEVLYYLESRRTLRDIARRIREHLRPGGLVLMAHGNVAANAPEETGFDWGHLFDARSIGEVFGATPGLRLVREARSPLYRIQMFEAIAADDRSGKAPETAEVAYSDRLTFYVSSQIQWNGCAAHRQTEVTDRLPILMYHRVAEDGPAMLSDYRVTPERFDAQMRHLAEQGYYGVTLDAWEEARARHRGLPGRAVAITFDDGYEDFHEHAWPILQKYGFPATVFVVPDHVGGRADWDAAYGEPAPLMSWDRIREVHRQGVAIGSHTMSHAFLTTLSHADVAKEVTRSREVIEQEIDEAVTWIAYPYGDHDEVVERIVADCGYTAAVNTSGASSRLSDRPFSLGRMEFAATDGPEQIARILPRPQPAGRLRHARVAVRNGIRRVRRDLF